ncbi:MAG TPA: hypothetical protein VF538_16860 [Pyrinomonadaceae bacterium]|jgi:hypothetical protein
MTKEKTEPTVTSPASNSGSSRETAADLVEGGTVSGMEIEGGSISEFELYPKIEFHEAQHRADTARRLAYWLVIILGVSIVAHYFSTMLLEIYGKHDAVESLGKIFNTWLPVLSGLVGGATTFYFTREK